MEHWQTLAETMIPMSEGVQMLVVLLLGLGIGGGGAAAITNRGSGKQRLAGGNSVSVELIDNLATKPELTEMERRFVAQLADLKLSWQRDTEASRRDSEAQFSRINAISRELATTTGELRQVNANIERLYEGLGLKATRRRTE